MTKVLLIAVGGGVGSVLRYAVSGWAQRMTSSGFPSGTLAVNVLGCLVIGFLGAALAGPVLVREEYRVAVMVGCLGGFTTFSTYGLETVALASDGQAWRAVVNVLLQNALGLSAVWIGYRWARAWVGV
ncbi:MAG: fluoride efflux transporter CrcB [Phycisphaerae bacterium]